MSEILNSVNQRTQLVGENRLELLLFKLNSRQRFGINVFKVREVLQCPKLSSMPKLHQVVRGIAHIRGQTISVIDLSKSTGGRAIEQTADSYIIIAEYNRSVQGFLVAGPVSASASGILFSVCNNAAKLFSRIAILGWVSPSAASSMSRARRINASASAG